MIFGTRPGLKKLDRPQSLLHRWRQHCRQGQTENYLDFHLAPLLSMDDHVKETVRACNYHIRALRHVRKSLTLEVTRTIVHGLVTARLDYCNALLLGTTRSSITKLQHVQCDLAKWCCRHPGGSVRNPSSKSSTGSQSKSVSFSRFAVCMLIVKCLKGLAPAYLIAFCTKGSAFSCQSALRSVVRWILLCLATWRIWGWELLLLLVPVVGMSLTFA